ncbi:hypothetical protein LCGC14_2157630 [marine sediment metagenome]|uniref:Uncharacterized protein n=1 Tax=marine sediment metagenome TaxID=412755 RepID=A0A0F9GPW7_9ZZZZ
MKSGDLLLEKLASELRLDALRIAAEERNKLYKYWRVLCER